MVYSAKSQTTGKSTVRNIDWFVSGKDRELLIQRIAPKSKKWGRKDIGKGKHKGPLNKTGKLHDSLLINPAVGDEINKDLCFLPDIHNMKCYEGNERNLHDKYQADTSPSETSFVCL